MRTPSRHGPLLRERGATLIIGLIMIVLITLIVVNAFTLSSSNLKSVGNMQVRGEAVAAANQAIEKLISSTFTSVIGTVTFAVDINKDGATDYSVAIAQPTCVKSVAASEDVPSQIGFPLGSSATWINDWDVDARVTDVASGASVRVRQGVRLPPTPIACP